MPLYSASWMIPVVEVHRFLHPYVGPASELPLCDNGHEVCHIKVSIALIHANIDSDSSEVPVTVPPNL